MTISRTSDPEPSWPFPDKTEVPEEANDHEPRTNGQRLFPPVVSSNLYALFADILAIPRDRAASSRA
jgi:hypothetical protein